MIFEAHAEDTLALHLMQGSVSAHVLREQEVLHVFYGGPPSGA